MPNRAKAALEVLLGLCRKYNWSGYPFPGRNIVGVLRLQYIKEAGRELTKKAAPPYTLSPHHCWNNARYLAAEFPTMEYWEGFIADENSAWPTPHAWNVQDGCVIDSTVDSSKFDYFGIPGKVF